MSDNTRHSWLFGEDAPEHAADRILEALDIVHNPEQLRTALWSQYNVTDPLQRLAGAVETLNVRCTTLVASVDEIACTINGELIAVGYKAGPDGGWVVLTDRFSNKLQALCDNHQTQELSHQELAKGLGASGTGEALAWVLMTRARPLAHMSTDHIRTHGLVSTVPEGQTASPLARLIALMRFERRDIKVVLVFSVAVGLLMLVTPVVMQVIVNTVAFGTPLQPLVVLLVLLLSGLGFAAALRALEVWVVEMIQRRILLRLVGDLAHRLPGVKGDAFDDVHGPELVNRFFDVFTVKKVIAWLLVQGLEIILTVLIGMTVLAFYHPLLLAFDVVLLVSAAIVLRVMGRGGVKTAIKESKAKYALAGWLEELARHPLIFKADGGASFGVTRADARARAYLKARHAHFKIVFGQMTGTLALQALATTALIGAGAWLIMERQLTLGQLVAAELIVTVVVNSLTKLAQYLESLYDMMAAIDKVGQLVDLPLERQDGVKLKEEGKPRAARLTLKNVHFGFDPSRPIFRNMTLDLEAGARLAIHGPAGSGKSALLELLFGLRQPQKGHIALDGMDLREMSLRSLRQRVAIVRGAEIFEGTILENLQLGRTELTLEQIDKALEQVHLLDLIRNMPDGLQTQLASGAPTLSNSQAMRLTLARAIVGQPSLLVVDEIFGKMSIETAQYVLSNLTSKDAPWTLITITRDPAIHGRCGQLMILKDGALHPASDATATA